MDSEFASFLLNARRQKFRSARAFYTAHKFSFSYQCYAGVERGEHPSFDVALSIIKALKLNVELALRAWVRDQLPPSYKHIFTDSEEQTQRTEKFESKVQVMNRMQAKLIEKDPLYLDLLIYLACYSQFSPVSTKEVSDNLQIIVEAATLKLDSLYDYGIVDRDKDGYVMDKWAIFPERDEFTEIRQKNFLNAINNHKQVGFNASTIRYSITRLLNRSQREELKGRMKALREWIISLEDDPKGELFSTILAGNKRSLGGGANPCKKQS